MTVPRIEHLNAEQKDQLLLQLLSEHENVRPTSKNERAAAEAIDEHFCSELSDEMLEAPAQVASRIECDVDASLLQVIWDFEDYLSLAFEDYVISEFDTMFKAGRDTTCEALEGEVDVDFLRKVRNLLPSRFDEAAKAALIAEFQDEIPEIVDRAIIWGVDTDAIENAIYGFITRFLSAAIIPNLKAQICGLGVESDFEVTAH